MSYRWKQFVKGPTLKSSKATNSPETEVKPRSELFSVGLDQGQGEDVHLFYESVIKESAVPPTSVGRKPERRVRSSDLNKDSSSNTLKPPQTSLNEILRIVEHNQVANLESLSTATNFSQVISESDSYGWTPLMVAACAGSTECVELLLRYGADYGAKDKKGFTALDLAKTKNRTSTCEVIYNWIHRAVEYSEAQSSSESSVEPGFCDSCKTEFSHCDLHKKSIAHLVSTASGVVERTHYGIPESNRGFQLLLRTGWDKESGLGPEGKGQKFPVKTVLKVDRTGVGSRESNRLTARVTHFGPYDTRAVEGNNEARKERKNTLLKKERVKQRTKEIKKEIHYRRELGSL